MKKKTKKFFHVSFVLLAAILNLWAIDPGDRIYSAVFDLVITIILLGIAAWIYFGDYYE
jgi:hypothetical protein